MFIRFATALHKVEQGLCAQLGNRTQGHSCKAQWWPDRYKYVKGPRFQYGFVINSSVTSKKTPNVHKSCPKMILQEKLKILTPLQKLPKNLGDLGKLIVAKGFE